MSYYFHDSIFDVAIAAGPRIVRWPSVGVKKLSSICGENGLKVGLFGGQDMRTVGVLPSQTTGGLLIVEDQQGRLHRYEARAIVRVKSDLDFPDPFPGWRSQAVIPFSTAQRLLGEGRLTWNPLTIVFGSGNKALRLASELIEKRITQDVVCVESRGKWGKKNFAGWEVEKRRFEINDGDIIHGKPLSIRRKSALLWEMRIQDNLGIRILEFARAISVGPFAEFPGVREFPPGSFLFEFDQTSGERADEDIEGWELEEDRGRWLGIKLVRDLVLETSVENENAAAMQRKARVNLRSFERHRKNPFIPEYSGKWISSATAQRIKNFEGVPQARFNTQLIATLECFEAIKCNRCELSCPESAIRIDRGASPTRGFLIENNCTGCGECLKACPSRAVSMIHAKEKLGLSEIVVTYRGKKKWRVSELADLISRSGERMGVGRVLSVDEETADTMLIKVEVPIHLMWDIRGIRSAQESLKMDHDESYVFSPLYNVEKETVQVTIDSEKRRLRNDVTVSMALFEIGQSRPVDVFLCGDGSCGLCEITVDGRKQKGCQTKVRKGMVIITDDDPTVQASDLCPCIGVSVDSVIERIKKGSLKTPESVLSVTKVGQGQCHGQRCMGAMKRLLHEQGFRVEDWIDWRFPWFDWTLHSSI